MIHFQNYKEKLYKTGDGYSCVGLRKELCTKKLFKKLKEKKNIQAAISYR